MTLERSYLRTKLGSLDARVRAAWSMQYAGWPVVQYLHERQAAAERMTRSPTEYEDDWDWEPRRTMRPAPIGVALDLDVFAVETRSW